jgi:hypothetical protein
VTDTAAAIHAEITRRLAGLPALVDAWEAMALAEWERTCPDGYPHHREMTEAEVLAWVERRLAETYGRELARLCRKIGNDP